MKTTSSIRNRAPKDATHWGIIAGCVEYFTVIDGKCFYKGKPWHHATVMKLYKL